MALGENYSSTNNFEWLKQGASGAGSGAMMGSAFGPWGTAIGAGIGAIGGIASGAMAEFANRAQSEEDYERQKEFAQNSIQWRVADAKKAGINPLAALGSVGTGSYTPSYTSGGMAESVASSTQSIQQGFSQYAQMELMKQNLERGRLENELLKEENKQAGIRSAKMTEDLVSSINGLGSQVLGMNISKKNLQDNALEGMQDGYLKILASLVSQDSPKGKKSDLIRSIASSAPVYVDKQTPTAFDNLYNRYLKYVDPTGFGITRDIYRKFKSK